MRADARRNRDRILGAARTLVDETGVDATMEDIARRAGVAVGTLYRHFPAKEDLVAAVVDDSIEQMTRLTEQALAAVDSGASAGPELATLFRAVADRHATDRTFKAAAGRLDMEAELASAEPGTTLGRAVGAITALLDRARAAAAVRPDTTLADLVMLLGAMPGPETPVVMRSRYVEIVMAGLAPGSTGARSQP